MAEYVYNDACDGGPMRKTIFRLVLISIAVLLAAVAPAAAQTGTVVRVEPAFQQVAPGTTFTLTIQIDDVVNLYAYEVTLNFPADALSVIDAQNGGFLQNGWLIIDNETPGTLIVGYTQVGETPPADGNGTLVMITFDAIVEQSDADIIISNVVLVDNEMESIPCSLQHGRVHIGAYPLYLPLVLR